jgi:hypothetical protein
LIYQASPEEPLADIINLNRARKAKAKDVARETAATNRAAHGRTRAERQATETERSKASRLLDGAKRETPEES